MRYFALASDYDGTLAEHGKVNQNTIESLERLKNTGRKLLLVTGRRLPELLDIFPEVKLFDIVIAENGALLYYPETGEQKPLADPPPPQFIKKLKEYKVSPFTVGKVIVATWRPFETEVLKVIHELGLQLQIIFNKEAVMIMPSGVNKAFGLAKAVNELNLSPLSVAAVGDAENDLSFLRAAGFAAAVSNAVPMLKETADICLEHSHGEGVSELIEMLIKTDLKEYKGEKKVYAEGRQSEK